MKQFLSISDHPGRWFVAALVLALIVELAGCTPAQQQRAVVDGQLFCGFVTPAGLNMTVGIANAAGGPVVVNGLGADVVASYCAAIDGVPVVPPVNPAAAPVVAVAVTPPPASP